jgi:hypothetical protein
LASQLQWSAEVVAAPSNPPNTSFNYDLRLSGPVITYTTDVLGALTDPNKPGFYALSADAKHTSLVLSRAQDKRFPQRQAAHVRSLRST